MTDFSKKGCCVPRPGNGAFVDPIAGWFKRTTGSKIGERKAQPGGSFLCRRYREVVARKHTEPRLPPMRGSAAFTIPD